jgi:hypothetical protein
MIHVRYSTVRICTVINLPSSYVEGALEPPLKLEQVKEEILTEDDDNIVGLLSQVETSHFILVIIFIDLSSIVRYERSCFLHRCVDTTNHFIDILLFKVHRGRGVPRILPGGMHIFG